MKEGLVDVQIIEDNVDTVNYLQLILSDSKIFRINKIFPSYESAFPKFSEYCPFWIIDIGLPGKSGISALESIKQLHPESKVCMFTSIENPVDILECIRKGANGYLLKDMEDNSLIRELKYILIGGSPLTTKVAEKILEDYIQNRSEENEQKNSNQETEKVNLTKKQIEILNFISLGMTYSTIAKKINKSPGTIRKHIENIYKKLNVNSKAQAINAGIKMGYIKN